MLVTIRQAGKSDTDAVTSTGVDAQRFQSDLLGHVPPSGRSDFYGPLIDRNTVWLIEEGSDIVGVIVLERIDDHLLVRNIGVVPSRRGRGYGRRLLDFAEQRARELSLGELRLFSNSLNKPAIAIFEHVGYVAFGTHASRFPGQVLIDMAKRIHAA
jgi:ribosomal protein S18 acetylase RimI-like enzyme